MTTFEEALKNLGLEKRYIPASGVPMAILEEMLRIWEERREFGKVKEIK